MKQKIIFMGFIVFILTAVAAFSNSDQTERMDTASFEKAHRPGAVFVHDDHNEMAELEDCAVCHHVYEDKKLVEGESSEDSLCSDCHSVKATQDNSIPLEVAFHKRCKTCHVQENKGPLLCGECHIK